MLLVHLHRLLLATVEGPLVGPEEDPLGASDHPDLTGVLVLHPDVLADLEVDGLELVAIQQLLVRAGDHQLLPPVHRDLASKAVEQTDVLVGLQGQDLPHTAVDLPGRLEEDHRLPLLNPPLTRGFVLDADVLVVLQGDGHLLVGVPLEGALGKPHAGPLHSGLLSREPVVDGQVLGLAEGNCLSPARDAVVGAEEELLRAPFHALLPRDAVPQEDEVHGAEHLGLPLLGAAIPERVDQLDPRTIDDSGLAEVLHHSLLALVKEDDRAESQEGQDQEGHEAKEGKLKY
mmetsp:Transcript_79784/g.234702  ORF Transcript_79784/g.234702 Transcript_79784/m.234702 type:complete len:288 (-) Transcript_79784:26-889(-)